MAYDVCVSPRYQRVIIFQLIVNDIVAASHSFIIRRMATLHLHILPRKERLCCGAGSAEGLAWNQMLYDAISDQSKFHYTNDSKNVSFFLAASRHEFHDPH